MDDLSVPFKKAPAVLERIALEDAGGREVSLSEPAQRGRKFGMFQTGDQFDGGGDAGF